MSDGRTAKPRLTVIIPVRDDPRIESCVASVLACDRPAGGLQLLVVDNGSGPAMDAVLARLAEDELVTILREPSPGVYRARNRGIEAASGDVIFFTDADCTLDRGWLAAGTECLQAGADLVQGFSGGQGKGRVGWLLQQRYGAHLESLPPGSAVEIDSRNLGVKRAVFDRLRFNPAYRRVGDTEFGLRAEALGHRVRYCPAMRLDHAHTPDFALFVAKQVCHGWGAQRLMYESPGLPWHGGHLKAAARMSGALRGVPGRGGLARLIARGAVTGARMLQHAPYVPDRAALLMLAALDKAAGLAGHLMFVPGSPEPYVSDVLGRALPRE